MKSIYMLMVLLSLCSFLTAQDPVVFASLSNRTTTVQDSFVVFATLGTTHATVENGILITDDISYYYQSGGTTAVHDVPQIEGLTIYPNPTTSSAILQRQDQQGKLKIRLHASDGRILLENNWMNEENTFTLSLEWYPGGIYFLTVADEQEKRASRFRIVKQ